MKRVDVVYSLLTNPSKSKVLAVRNVGRSSWSRRLSDEQALCL